MPGRNLYYQRLEMLEDLRMSTSDFLKWAKHPSNFFYIHKGDITGLEISKQLFTNLSQNLDQFLRDQENKVIPEILREIGKERWEHAASELAGRHIAYANCGYCISGQYVSTELPTRIIIKCQACGWLMVAHKFDGKIVGASCYNPSHSIEEDAELWHKLLEED